MPNASKGSGKLHTGGGRTPVRPNVRGGPANTKKISVEAAASQGNKRGNHFMGGSTPVSKAGRPPLVTAKVPQVANGNEVALRVGRGGPGADRTIYKSGTQGCQGAVNQGANSGSPFLPGGPNAGGGMSFPGKGKVV